MIGSNPRISRRRAPRARCIGPAVLVAALAATARAPAQNLQGRVVEHTLKNGLKIMLVERHAAPVFSAVMDVRVGGVDEQMGRTGLAHMFEHMAFKGTRVIGTRNYAAEEAIMRRADVAAEALRRYMAQAHPDRAGVARRRAAILKISQEAQKYIVKDELDELYSRNGAVDINAFTSTDMTSYHVSLPSNRFELWCLVESQRFAAPVLREFYSERNVVAEERRLRTENEPAGKLYETTQGTAFLAHPYRNPIIGWMNDIQGLTRPEAVAFRKLYYIPNNAVMAIVGDVKPAQAIPLLEKYFGPIPASPPPPLVTTKEPQQEGERRVEIDFNAQPQVLMMYHKPTLPDFPDFAFDLISAILSQGRTSRLYTTLVKNKRLAVGVTSENGEPGARYPNLFTVSATPRFPHTSDEVLTAISDEIDRLRTEPVNAEELEKAKNREEATFVYGLESNLDLAQELADFQLLAGDWRYVLRWRETLRKITPADLMAVARKYLVKGNRTVGTLVPTAAPAARPASAGPNGGGA